jgi:hypothetical protein
MHRRLIIRYLPVVERLEEKQLLSVGPLPTDVANPKAGSLALALRAADASGVHRTAAIATSHTGLWVPSHHRQRPLPKSFLVFRITNTPYQTPVNNLLPPFITQQVLVQSRQPIPGQVYNVLFVVVKNGTAQTFTASNGFTVRLSNQAKSLMFPILTGTQQWKPNQWIVFYVLTKKYYPVSPVPGGFELFLGGRRSTLVPGPSGIFLRLKYKPATFARTLDWIVAFGHGAEEGAGATLGLPDTAVNQVTAAITRRIDFAGHF